jgi:Uma2 family endonuclease
MASAELLTHPVAEEKSPRMLCADEFLDWLQPKVYADLIFGEIFMHSPVSLRHAHLLNFVDRLLAGYIEVKGLGTLFRENVAVRLGERNVFMPDLCFFTNEQIERLAPNFAPVAPTLAVEVLSPSSIDRDERTKFIAYEAHGVMEYWILDPERQMHQFYRRVGKVFKLFSDAKTDVVESEAVPGFFLKRFWLNSWPQPPVKDCLADILSASVKP